ncbi:MAG: hypothetical protein WC307_06105 [Candidatus Nanoarchaeia archaeon]|jgi:hypothetical protein
MKYYEEVLEISINGVLSSDLKELTKYLDDNGWFFRLKRKV